MRRKTQKTLANLGRLLGLGGCAMALATAYVWRFEPEAVDELEARLEHRLTFKAHELRHDARHEKDPAVRRERWLALLLRLADVGPKDRLADIVKECYAGLSSLSAASGDVAEAVRWMETSVAFDGRDLRTLAELSALRTRVAATRQQGLDELAGLVRRHPNNPIVVPAFVESLVRLDRCGEAILVLEKAHQASQSNLWKVLWDPGSEIEVHIAPMVPVVQDGALRMRFDVADRVQRLRFLPPPFASFILLEPRLHVVVGAHSRVVDLLGTGVTLHQMTRSHDRLEAVGHFDTIVDVDLPDLPEGNVECTFTALVQPRRSSLLGWPVVTAPVARWSATLDERGDLETRRVVREWRRVACAGLDLEVFHRDDTTDFSPERKVAAAIECPPEGDTWAAAFEIQQPVTVLRLDLPQARPGFHCDLLGIDVMVDGRIETLDPRTMPLLDTVDCERRDGGFESLGPDPYFLFQAPVGARMQGLRVRGVL